MIICVSILDKHKPTGQRHVGIYTFEIPYDGNSHFHFLTVACPVEDEPAVRPHVNRLMSRDDLRREGGVINGRGEEV